MTRAVAALVLLVAFTAAGFGWRTVVQVRRHGDTGWRFSRTGPDRIVGPALVLAFALLGVGPVVALVGSTPSTGGAAAAGIGAALAVGAGVLTVVAQVQMGASWRIGVEAGERTDLVTGGLFGRVRNPIFTGMLAFALGLALLVPNVPTVLGAALAVVTIQAQVRLVEEPNLVAVHGEAYRRWAGSTGRFVPGLGRL
jgi:protein-S-isoprenylcysteine O-methyltransferase Ste14